MESCQKCGSLVKKTYFKRGYQDKMCWECHSKSKSKELSKSQLRRINQGHSRFK